MAIGIHTNGEELSSYINWPGYGLDRWECENVSLMGVRQQPVVSAQQIQLSKMRKVEVFSVHPPRRTHVSIINR